MKEMKIHFLSTKFLLQLQEQLEQQRGRIENLICGNGIKKNNPVSKPSKGKKKGIRDVACKHTYTQTKQSALLPLGH